MGVGERPLLEMLLKAEREGRKSVVFLPLSLPSCPHHVRGKGARDVSFSAVLHGSETGEKTGRYMMDTLRSKSQFILLSDSVNPRTSSCAGQTLCHPPEAPHNGLGMRAIGGGHP